MHLLLNNTGGVPARPFPVPESNRSGSPVSTFSLLLAGKLAGSSKGESEIENRHAHGDSDSGKEHSDPEALAADRTTVSSNPDQPQGSDSAKQVTDDGAPTLTAGEATLAGELGSHGGLAGLLFTAEAVGMGNGTTSGFAITDGVPADFSTRLAGDIAAGFSNRNGIQTLVLKLDSDHLGQVDVRMQAKDDHLTVRLLAADRESEAALRGNIKELSEAIQKRTGRFQHVEVRVELKGGEDPGREPREKDPEHSSGHNFQEGNSGDPDTRRDPENQNTREAETGPADGAQEG